MKYAVEILQTVPEPWWNSLVARHAGADIFQTTHWAAVEKDRGHDTLYAIARDQSGHEVGGLALLVEPYYSWLSFSAHPRLHSISKSLVPVFRWRRGPLVWSDVDQAEIVHVLLTEVAAYGKRHGVVGIMEATALPEALEIGTHAAIEASTHVRTHATFLVDLSRGQQACWDGASKVARKAVRKADSQGITVRTVTDVAELDTVLEILAQAWDRQGSQYGRQRDVLDIYWNQLRPNGHVEFFIAEVDGVPAATMSVWQFNGFICEFLSGRTHDADSKHLNVGDALKWAIIKWACEKGYRTYDLAGVNPNPASAKEHGIFSFKKKWGGRYVEYPIITKPIRRCSHALLSGSSRLLRHIRQRWLS